MSTYLKLLLLVHIGGAIIGIGPTFAFGIMGRTAAEGGERALHAVEMISKISNTLVKPVALVTQPLSGALLIFEAGYNRVFWSQEWLYTAIILYAAVLVVAYLIDNPIVARIIQLMKTGRTEGPEFAALVKRTTANGMFMGIATTIIVFLMIWKPGL